MIVNVAAARSRVADPGCLVRWIFHRGGSALTCRVDARATSSYDVSIVPHWNISAAAVEALETPGRALQRHAEIAKQLREGGWLVAHRHRVDVRQVFHSQGTNRLR